MESQNKRDRNTGLETSRKPQRVPAWVLTPLSCAIACYHLLFVSMLFTRAGINIMTQQHRALSLGSLLLLTFLTRAAGKKVQGRLPWYDMLFILSSLLPTGYYAFFYSTVTEHYIEGTATGMEVVFCFLLLIAIFEAGRRMVGWSLPIVASLFVIHALTCQYLPGILFGRAVDLQRLAAEIYLGIGGVFGFPIWIVSTVVITFIIFSQLLAASGGGRFFLNLALALMGSVRGGPAKAAVIASSLFATLSGSTVGNVAATGTVTIPLMKNIGYKPYFAGAVEAVASKGGQITPPIMGAVAFLMVEMTGYSYFQVCAAAALPAFLYYLSLFIQVDFRAAQTGLKGISRTELPSLKDTLREGWQYLIPIAGLVILIVLFQRSPETAAFYSMGVLWIASMFRKDSRLGTKKIIEGLSSGAVSTLYAAMPCALAGVILASIAATGLGLRFSGQIVDLSGGNLIVLVALAGLASFILGMGMTSIAIYIILATLIGPILVNMGVNVLAAHLFLVFWGNVSFITPPVAVAAYAAAGIAGADPMKTGWQACRLGIVSFLIPFIFIWNPSLVLVGPPGEVIITALTAIAGVCMLAAGVEGYLPGGRLRWDFRILILIGAILMLVPGWKSDILGLAFASPVLLKSLFIRKRYSAR